MDGRTVCGQGTIVCSNLNLQTIQPYFDGNFCYLKFTATVTEALDSLQWLGIQWDPFIIGKEHFPEFNG